MMTELIDTHVHLWDPHLLRYTWLDGLPRLNRPHLPADFQATAGHSGRIIFMECGCDPRQARQEVTWVTQLARDPDSRLAGIVASAPLEQGRAVEDDLAWLSGNPLVKGVRRLIQDEANDFCVLPGFLVGLGLLSKFHFPFDICIKHTQLANAAEMARRCPGVRFILDHFGKPAIRDRLLDPWRGDLERLAALPNTFCKLSGLVTEANHQYWKREDLEPYVRHAVDCFGPDRLLFGGDWPVVELASTYERWVETVEWLLRGLTGLERDNIFGRNAERVYGLADQGG